MVSLKRGDITQNSFGFIVEDDTWDEDEEGNTIRTINKVGRLLDVSLVVYPAYPDAEIGKRNFLNYRAKKEQKENKKEQQYRMPGHFFLCKSADSKQKSGFSVDCLTKMSRASSKRIDNNYYKENISIKLFV